MFSSPANSVPLSIIALSLLFFTFHGIAQPQIGENGLFDEYLRQLDKRNPLKKSAGFSDFVGSLNGAARLRYGKRSDGRTPEEIEEIVSLLSRETNPFNRMDRWQMVKRAPNYAEALPVGLLDQLNGAERLRFGRK